MYTLKVPLKIKPKFGINFINARFKINIRYIFFSVENEIKSPVYRTNSSKDTNY